MSSSSSLFSYEKNVWFFIPSLFSFPKCFFQFVSSMTDLPNNFLYLWGICLILVSLLYSRFELLLMHSNPLCNYLMKQTIMLQGWLLYTYSIQFSVQIIIQSLLWVILHVQLIIVVSKINLSLGSISTSLFFSLVFLCMLVRIISSKIYFLCFFLAYLIIELEILFLNLVLKYCA